MLRLITAAALCAAWLTASAQGNEHVVGQKDRAFTTKALKAKVGDSVSFRNDDPFFHNVFSLSDSHAFDLGSYPKGQARKTTLTKPGKIEVECAIHPEMKMVIQVEK